MAHEGVLVLGETETAPSFAGIFNESPGGNGVYAKARPAVPRLSAAI
jgi:chemotaxis methyl-accepting protein methylase